MCFVAKAIVEGEEYNGALIRGPLRGEFNDPAMQFNRAIDSRALPPEYIQFRVIGKKNNTIFPSRRGNDAFITTSGLDAGKKNLKFSCVLHALRA